MPLAQQRRVPQAGLAAVDPLQHMMDVAPVAGRVAAGEHAVPIAQLDRPAQLRRDQSPGPPVVQRHPVGAEHDPGRGPSQAAQRARAADRMAPKPVVAAPAPVEGSTRSAAGIITSICGFTVRSLGRSP